MSLSYLVYFCLAAFLFDKQPKIAVLSESLQLALFVIFKIFRHKFPQNTKLHEYVIIGIVVIPTILCSLVNRNHIPEKLQGPGIENFRVVYIDKFYIIAMFSLVNLEYAIIFMAPLYLLSQYFYLLWQKEV